MDLSYFNSAISPASPEIKLGYASITWGGNDRQAIEDISALGFPGIQLRSNLLKSIPDPTEVKGLLQKQHLTFVALSSGGVNIETPSESDEIAKHMVNAKYAQDAGCLYLQVTDNKPKRTVTADDYKKLGRLITEIGKRSADLGITVGYHNHMGSMGQAPEEVDRILDACDPRYAKLELDIAHYVQGGGDPVKAIHKYHDRLLFLHIKDVEDTQNQSAPDGKGYRFVELGRGRVDLPATFQALQKIKFHGWAVVELDGVPDPKRTPKECAEISKKYLEEKMRLAL